MTRRRPERRRDPEERMFYFVLLAGIGIGIALSAVVAWAIYAVVVTWDVVR